MDEVNYIVFADQGLVTYRFDLPDGGVQEFDDLEEAIGFAAANDVYEVGVVFPDGDVHTIPLGIPGLVEPRDWSPPGTSGPGDQPPGAPENLEGRCQ